ncbi:MAG: molybdopterin-dependent oxidoreductase [Coriobacteriia bacterium]|nr:molybdopterin-dependent oxidoreductase [Coriobacteriia bacterium]
MGSILQEIKEKGLSRRTFVAGSALAVATLALQGCADDKKTENELKETEETEPVVEGEWVPVICNNHCMGMCALKVYMVDGIPIRMKTDDTHPDTPDYPQRRACQLGRSRLNDNFGPMRLKYPMKRKNWKPGGGANSTQELRGKDEWERISWDEAIDSIATEMTRIKEAYGNRAILGLQPKRMDRRGMISPDTANRYGYGFMNALNLFGGFTASWGPWSSGSWTFSTLLYGMSSSWNNDRLDCRNCEYAIVIGNNAVVSTDGASIHVLTRPMKEAGVKFYYVDPMYHDTMAAVDAEWVPIRPATDKALLMGMAYVMFTEDDPIDNPIIDWEFLETYTIGYDADHMPEGVEDTTENFKDYILGTYDGIPKDPAWAENITGVPAAKIFELGLVMAKDNKTALIGGVAPARTNTSEVYTQMIMAVGTMGGHLGKSGHFVTGSMPGNVFNGGSLVREGGFNLVELENPVEDSMDHSGIWKSLSAKRYRFTGDQEFLPYEMRDLEVKCLYCFVMNMVQSTVNMAGAVEYFRTGDLDLFVSHSITLNDTSRFADFVLPCLTPMEMCDMIRSGAEYLTFGMKVVEPIYEAKSYQWIGAELLKKWGIDPALAYPISEAQQNFAMVYGAEVRTADGKDWQPLISFTAEEAASTGLDCEPRAEGAISYTDIKKQGIYQIPRSPGDPFTSLGGASFVNDPVKNAVGSGSGKLEFYSSRSHELSNNMGQGYLHPLPKYVPTVNGYEYTFSDFEKGIKGDTPFQYYSPHYPRVKHSHFDNIDTLREAFIRPVWINSKDAQAKGISDGDTVRLFNENGSALRPACVTERVMPGVIGLPHGAQCLLDESNGFNIAGSDNWLSYSVSTGLGTAGYNSQRCDIEKWSTPLPADLDLPNPTPDFQRVTAFQQA